MVLHHFGSDDGRGDGTRRSRRGGPGGSSGAYRAGRRTGLRRPRPVREDSRPDADRGRSGRPGQRGDPRSAACAAQRAGPCGMLDRFLSAQTGRSVARQPPVAVRRHQPRQQAGFVDVQSRGAQQRSLDSGRRGRRVPDAPRLQCAVVRLGRGCRRGRQSAHGHRSAGGSTGGGDDHRAGPCGDLRGRAGVQSGVFLQSLGHFGCLSIGQPGQPRRHADHAASPLGAGGRDPAHALGVRTMGEWTRGAGCYPSVLGRRFPPRLAVRFGLHGARSAGQRTGDGRRARLRLVLPTRRREFSRRRIRWLAAWIARCCSGSRNRAD
jgi:hypothetical protein